MTVEKSETNLICLMKSAMGKKMKNVNDEKRKRERDGLLRQT